MKDHTPNVLVLGATGFIGGHIARSALEAGWRVGALRRTPGAKGHLGEAPVGWVDGNLEDIDSLKEAMFGREIVFHAAGYYPKRRESLPVQQQVELAFNQTMGVIQAARSAGVSRLVYTSTLTTVGHPPPPAHRLANEADFYQPGSLAKNAYYEAKFVMEQAMIHANGETLSTVILNPTAVLGPGDVHLTLGSLLLAVRRGRAIAWLPVTINVIDVRDVAQAHIQAALSATPGERYILGGHNLTLREAITIAAQVAQVPPPRFEIPFWVVDALIRLDDALPFVNLSGNHLRAIHYWQGYDTSKARRDLGLSSRPFEETLRDAYRWFREHRYLP